MSPDNRRALRWQLVALTFCRLLINTGLRLTYPFLPALARGTGVSLVAASRLVALRGVVGVTSPLFSPISERFGRRAAIVLAGLVFSFGCLVVFVWPGYWPLGLTLIFIGLSKVIYDPALYAYIGDVVPYQERGRAVAVAELAWAGALLIGAPAVGWTISRYGWSTPFAFLAVLGLLATVAIWFIMPPSKPAVARAAGPKALLHLLRHERVVWAVAIYTFLIMCANELVLIIYGDWFETEFSLNLTNLGLAAGVIGGAEIVGEITAGVAVDRFGKRPVILLTAGLCTLGYLLAPFVSVTLVAALVALFLLFLTFEITVVGGIPLVTEVLPAARSLVLSLGLAFGSLGRAAGALLGPPIWERFSLPGVGLSAALIMAVAMVILARWIREAPAEEMVYQPPL